MGSAMTHSAQPRAQGSFKVRTRPIEPGLADVAQLARTMCATPWALVLVHKGPSTHVGAHGGLAIEPLLNDAQLQDLRQPPHTMVAPGAMGPAPWSASGLHAGLSAHEDHLFLASACAPCDQDQAWVQVCVFAKHAQVLSAEQGQGLAALARQAAKVLDWQGHTPSQHEWLHELSQTLGEPHLFATAMATHCLSLHAYVDHNMVYRYANHRFLDYWRVTRQDIEGQSVARLLGPEVFKLVRPMLERALLGEALTYQAEIEYPPPLGRRHMRVDYIPVRKRTQAVCGVAIRVDDLHEVETARLSLSLLNEQLSQRNAMQDRFIHMVSHDLREPVNTICNFASLLQEDHASALGKAARMYLEFIARGGDRMKALLDDLLAHVNLDASTRQALRHEPVCLQDVFRDITADLHDAITRTGAQLIAHDLPLVWGDATLLRLLFQNLVSNALKFHPQDLAPVVEWGGRQEGSWVCVWIKDQGIGMDPKQTDKLFQAFSRLVTRRAYEGSGLGLASCQRIVDWHDGRIAVSTAKQAGSTFSVWLPSLGAAAPTH